MKSNGIVRSGTPAEVCPFKRKVVIERSINAHRNKGTHEKNANGKISKQRIIQRGMTIMMANEEVTNFWMPPL